MGRQQGLFAPGILVRMVLSFVRSSVQKAANFDIRCLRPIDSADKCFIPALFVAAQGDHFVSQKHSELLHAVYGGDKNLVVVEGDHNSPRPRFLYDSIGIFLASTLQIPEKWMLPDSDMYIRRVPWSNPLPGPVSFAQAQGGERRRYFTPAYVAYVAYETYFCVFCVFQKNNSPSRIHSSAQPLIHSTHTLQSYTPLIHSTHTPIIHSTHTLHSYTPLTLHSYTQLIRQFWPRVWHLRPAGAQRHRARGRGWGWGQGGGGLCRAGADDGGYDAGADGQ
jgi:hypothetical protein